MSAIDSALSGLNAASTRLNVAANNTANQFSTKSTSNGQTTNKPYTAQQVDQVSLSTGGTQAIVKNTNQPVDEAANAVQTEMASYNAKANLKVIQAQQAMEKSLVNIES